MEKPVVIYYKSAYAPVIGQRMYVGTRNHPSQLVTNNGDGWVRTSRVIKIDNEGGFETENTIYVHESS